MPTEPRLWASSDLVAEARARGFDATPRLITDWVRLGLLARPHRRGLGQGRGSVAGWEEPQFRLWLLLIEKRPTVNQVVTLANLPVSLWLYFGDQYVGLPQVKRALATWAGFTRAKGYEDAGRLVGQFLRELPDLKVPRDRRRAVRTKLVRVLANPQRKGDVLALRREIVHLIQPTPTRRNLKNQRQWENHVDLLFARLAGLQAVAAGTLPDSRYYWARTMTQYGRTSWGRVGGPPTPEELFPNACLDLVTTLGLSLSMPVAPPANPPSLLDPAVWDRGGLVDEMRTMPRLSPLMLPSGMHPMTGVRAEHHVRATRPSEQPDPGATE